MGGGREQEFRERNVGELGQRLQFKIAVRERPHSVQRRHLSKTSRWKGSRICHPEICYFGAVLILSYRHLKNSKCRESLSLNSPYLPKD